MNQANHPEIIQALGKIAACRNEVQGMVTFLEATSLWRPATALKKECREVLDIIDDNERRFERKLIVAVIGPGGSGKSTLVNALAGKDGLSDAGTRRPTTTEVVLICRSPGDADFLDPIFNPEDVRVIAEPGAYQMDHLLLVTHRTLTARIRRHISLSSKGLSRWQMCSCVFLIQKTRKPEIKSIFFNPMSSGFMVNHSSGS